MIDQYYVIGNPIQHSRSPEIHQRFAEQCGQSLHYQRYEAPLDGFTAAVHALVDQGMRGANVTVPFKRAAYDGCASLTERAQYAGAVNTISVDARGQCHGDNTDGIGLLNDLLKNQGVALAARRVLVLGAGGAVRGVLAPLLAQRPATVMLANRTHAKAEQLARDFAALGPVASCSLDALQAPGAALPEPFDIIINASSAGLHGAMPTLPAALLRPQGFCYDMVYGPQADAFLTWARRAGASRAVDGLGMLVEQAAASFHIWRGVYPAGAAVIRALRDERSD